MDVIEYKGQLKQYFYIPFYTAIVLLFFDVVTFIYNKTMGIFFFLIVCLYFLILIIFYNIFKNKFVHEIIDFATKCSKMQSILIDKFDVPYVLLDNDGKIIWHNEKFKTLTDKETQFRESISDIIPKITKNLIKEHDKFSNFEVDFSGRRYNAVLQKFEMPQSEIKSKLFAIHGKDVDLIALSLFDITKLTYLQEENENIKMIPTVVYIDNYEETIEQVDLVKRALLLAVIDRKVTQFFHSVDGIVQKIEKDKYFIVFEHRYLQKLKDTRFSILEDVKNIKVGNENEVTLSIGVGDGGDSYQQTFAYAGAAINIALGRGGSQAVIKQEGEVSYFGLHGKQVDKTTRVKARVKAQALRDMMESRENVIVMGHQISDIDAFGSAVGVCVAARKLGKKSQIVLNTITTSLRPIVDLIQSMENTEDLIITSEQAIKIVTPQTLVMVVDTNKENYTECPELLKKTEYIVVFDHHRQGEGVITNSVLSYIEPYASSACEMVAEVLQYFAENIQMKPEEADALYAGILIDTNNFVAKTGVRTFEAAAYLRRNGADMIRVRKLLRESMEAYKARAEVVRKAKVYRGKFAISTFINNGVESPTIIVAQAANELLDIVGIGASFVLTEYKNKIYISARSIDDVDVQLMMEKLGGGGHINLAGAQLENETLDSAIEKIENIIDDMIDKGEVEA